MGTQIEFNKILTLRERGKTLGERTNKHLPESLVKDRLYGFTEDGHRFFPLDRDIPLHTTLGGGELSQKALARVRVIDYTHRLDNDEKPITNGTYKIREVYTI